MLLNKKKIAAIAFGAMLGIAGTAFAAESADSFSDVPKTHWSYEALDYLAKEGIIEGMGDGTFQGGRNMTRYEMAAIVYRAVQHGGGDIATKSILDRLEKEYGSEIATLKQQVDKNTDDIQKLKDRVRLRGFVRAKYDNDDDNTGAQRNNRHFYMELEGVAKINKDWEAHFYGETRKGYTRNQSWRPVEEGAKYEDQDGTWQRIWVQGHTGAVNWRAGAAWWGLGFQNLTFGHAADGIAVDTNFAKNWNIKGFYFRPRQGDLVTMPDGQETTIRGASITGKIGAVDLALTYAGNDNYHGNDGHKISGHPSNQMMSRQGAIDVRFPIFKDLTATGTWIQTNADRFHKSRAYRLDYRNVDWSKKGSWSVYARYLDFGRYGDMSHDDEWNSLPTDMKGYILAFKFVPVKNVVWETFYSRQNRNYSGTIGGCERGEHRDLIRTQLDFHFE